jgi:hypothetical protein
MALRPDIVLGGTLPTRTGAFKDLVDTIGNIPAQRREMERQQLADEMAKRTSDQQFQIGEQTLAAGQREADLAEQQQMLIGVQRGINSFEANDMGGVEQAIMETTPPEEQQQELAEFRANRAQYISRAKAEVSAFQSQQSGGAEQRAKFIGAPQRIEEDGQSFLSGIVQNVDGSFTEKRIPVSGEFVSPLGETAEEQTKRKVREARAKAKSTQLGKLSPEVAKLAADKQARLDFTKSKSKFSDSAPKTLSAIGSAKATHALMSDTVTEIKSFISGLNAVYGGSLKGIPGSQARKLKGLINTMKANSAFGSLIDLKASGGTLGAISSTELELLEDKLGSLDQQGEIPEQLRVLDQILAHNQGSIDRMESAFASEKARFARGFDAPEPQQQDTGISADQFRVMSPEQRAEVIRKLQGQ